MRSGEGFDIADLQPTDFGQPQTGGVGRGQQGPGTQAMGLREQAGNLIAGENLRQAPGDFGHGDVEGGIRLAEHDTEQGNGRHRRPG